VLASGSTGNCALIATDTTRLLVDAGLSFRELTRRLSLIDEQPERLTGILITHEHSDHVSGLATLARRAKVPIYMTWLTAPRLEWNEWTPTIETFQAGARIAIGDIEIDSFTIPHDAADPVGFCFHADGVKIGLVTDLGYMPASVKFHLRGVQVLLLESNHDIEMLKVGPYPWSVKQRVMSRVGHLSNDVMCDFLLEDFDSSTENLILGHLSEHNNHPEIVRMMANQAMEKRGIRTHLEIAGQKQPTAVFQF
jgi:phosphoribosyl 1,2-cyclic phosphodiesterase